MALPGVSLQAVLVHLLGGGGSRVRLSAGSGRGGGEGALLRVPGPADGPGGVREVPVPDSPHRV